MKNTDQYPPQDDNVQMKYILIGLIKLYRVTLSKIKPPCCRFYPTCSVYGINAIRRFGSVKGGYLTLRRIVRCNPFNAGGYDPVPEEYRFFAAHGEQK